MAASVKPVHVTASISDVCDVTFEPISEAEAWAVIYQGCKTLRESFISGATWDGPTPKFLITPDTLQLSPEGSVQFAESMNDMSMAATNFMSPEVLTGQTPRLNKQLEAMHVFSLAATVFWGLTFKGKRAKEDFSANLKAVLSNMIQKLAELRSTLEDILEASTLEVGNLGGAPQPFIQNMAECVLGSMRKTEDNLIVPDIMNFFPTVENLQPINTSAFQPVPSINMAPGTNLLPENIIHRPTPSRPNQLIPNLNDDININPPGPLYMSPQQIARPNLPNEFQGGGYIPMPQMYNLPQNPNVNERRPRSQPMGNMYDQNFQNSDPRFITNNPHNLQPQTSYPNFGQNPRKPGYEENCNSNDNLLEERDFTAFPTQPVKYPLQTRATSTTDFDRFNNRPEMDYFPDEHNSTGKQKRVNANNKLKTTDTLNSQKSSSGVKSKGKSRGKAANLNDPGRKFGGPEFVHYSAQKPEIIQIPFQSNFLETGSSKPLGLNSENQSRKLKVELPNGLKLEVACEVNSTVQDIFDAVVTHLTLIEHSFFGLTHFQEDEYYFLEFPEKLSGIAPENWRHASSSTFTLYLQVKFFAPEISYLKHALTRHYFYLQLRKDILNDKYNCSEDLALILGSLAMQAEYGDISDEMVKAIYFRAEHYVAQSVITYLTQEYVHASLLALHRASSGLTPDEAEGKFIMECTRIDDYGRHFYKLFASVNEKTFNPVHICISTFGIDCWKLKEEDDTFRELTYSHPWEKIKSCSTKRRYFIVELFGDENTTHEYLVDSQKKGKYLLQLCSNHYKFKAAIAQAQNVYSNPGAITENQALHVENRISPSKPPREMGKEREIKVVKLQRKANEDKNLGIILSSINSNDAGTTVAEILPGSVAKLDGRIEPDDTILAINDRSLEGVNTPEANERLADAGRDVNLLLSQPVKNTMRNFNSLDARSKTNVGKKQNDYLFLHRSRTMPVDNTILNQEIYSAKPKSEKNAGISKVQKPLEAYLPDFKSEPPKEDTVKPFQTKEIMPQQKTTRAVATFATGSEFQHAREISSGIDSRDIITPMAAPRNSSGRGGAGRAKMEDRDRNRTVSSASEEARRADAVRKY